MINIIVIAIFLILIICCISKKDKFESKTDCLKTFNELTDISACPTTELNIFQCQVNHDLKTCDPANLVLCPIPDPTSGITPGGTGTVIHTPCPSDSATDCDSKFSSIILKENCPSACRPVAFVPCPNIRDDCNALSQFGAECPNITPAHCNALSQFVAECPGLDPDVCNDLSQFVAECPNITPAQCNALSQFVAECPNITSAQCNALSQFGAECPGITPAHCNALSQFVAECPGLDPDVCNDLPQFVAECPGLDPDVCNDLSQFVAECPNITPAHCNALSQFVANCPGLDPDVCNDLSQFVAECPNITSAQCNALSQFVAECPNITPAQCNALSQFVANCPGLDPPTACMSSCLINSVGSCWLLSTTDQVIAQTDDLGLDNPIRFKYARKSSPPKILGNFTFDNIAYDFTDDFKEGNIGNFKMQNIDLIPIPSMGITTIDNLMDFASVWRRITGPVSAPTTERIYTFCLDIPSTGTSTTFTQNGWIIEDELDSNAIISRTGSDDNKVSANIPIPSSTSPYMIRTSLKMQDTGAQKTFLLYKLKDNSLVLAKGGYDNKWCLEVQNSNNTINYNKRNPSPAETWTFIKRLQI